MLFYVIQTLRSVTIEFSIEPTGHTQMSVSIFVKKRK